MKDIKKNKQIKKRYIILIGLAIIIVSVLIIFAQFTSLGYRMTIPLRNFTKASTNTNTNIYIHNNFTNDKDNAVNIVDRAKDRVENYFGEIESSPMIIICDDKNTIAKLGGDHDTATIAMFKVYSYIVVSSEFLDVDIVAHEMTHAETHSRLLEGKFTNKSPVPLWFDEGLAMQNDYRERYNEDAWLKATDNGKNIVALSDIATAAQFYAGETEDRRYRFIISKHELNDWTQQNGIDGLLSLLEQVNQGVDFDSLYFTK